MAAAGVPVEHLACRGQIHMSPSSVDVILGRSCAPDDGGGAATLLRCMTTRALAAVRGATADTARVLCDAWIGPSPSRLGDETMAGVESNHHSSG
jgi:hypothetical protein